jgi:hypothetical protein
MMLVKGPTQREANVNIRIVEQRLLDRYIDQSDDGLCRSDLQFEELLAVSHLRGLLKQGLSMTQPAMPMFCSWPTLV